MASDSPSRFTAEVKAEGFLRDHNKSWYHRGVAGVGNDIDAVAGSPEHLRGIEQVELHSFKEGGHLMIKVLRDSGELYELLERALRDLG